MPGDPVLLGSYASLVMSWVLGYLSSCHPSGGVSLVLQNMGGSVELLRTSSGRVFCLIARLSPGLGVLGSPCLGFQWLSFRERVQCPLLSSWL